jgi:hypothetical protein
MNIYLPAILSHVLFTNDGDERTPCWFWPHLVIPSTWIPRSGVRHKTEPQIFQRTETTLLVGGFNPSDKYEPVGVIIPNIWKNKTCSKPQTSKTHVK